MYKTYVCMYLVQVLQNTKIYKELELKELHITYNNFLSTCATSTKMYQKSNISKSVFCLNFEQYLN